MADTWRITTNKVWAPAISLICYTVHRNVIRNFQLKGAAADTAQIFPRSNKKPTTMQEVKKRAMQTMMAVSSTRVA